MEIPIWWFREVFHNKFEKFGTLPVQICLTSEKLSTTILKTFPSSILEKNILSFI